MKKLLLVNYLLINSLLIFSQAPVVQWQKSFGGTFFEYAYDIQQTIDGGFIVAGYTTSNDGNVIGNHGGADSWILKLDNTGNIQWQKSLGGTNNDIIESIQQTSDGGYIVGGNSQSNDGDITGNHGVSDYWIAKLDNTGSIQWQKSLGGTADDYGRSIQQTTDGGYIMAGYSLSSNGNVTGNQGSYDYWIVKLDNSGNIQWQKSLGGTNPDEQPSIQQTIDGGYIVAGKTLSTNGNVTGNHGAFDAWVIKLTNTGGIQWRKCLGGSGYDIASSIQQTTDGGYIVGGNSSSLDGDVTGNHGLSDNWIVKLDNAGNIQWQKSLGGTNYETIRSIKETADGGYVMGGYSKSNDGDVNGNHGKADAWIVKISSTASIQWQKSLGGTEDEEIYSIEETADGGYIAAGYSKSNNGDVNGNHGSEDYWVVKLSPSALNISETSIENNYTIYPNPSINTITISFNQAVNSAIIKIFTLDGQQINETKNVNTNKFVFDMAQEANGMYFIEVNENNTISRKKFIKM